MFHLPSFGVLTSPITLASGSYPTGASAIVQLLIDKSGLSIYQLTTTQIKLQGDVTLSNKGCSKQRLSRSYIPYIPNIHM